MFLERLRSFTHPHITRRHLLPILWLIGSYIATVVMEVIGPPPDNRILFEARHIAIHTAGYAVQIWLIARALDLPRTLPGRERVGLIALAAVFGVGQEVLQSVMRSRMALLASAFDVGVDSMGAALALWLFSRRRSSTGSMDYVGIYSDQDS